MSFFFSSKKRQTRTSSLIEPLLEPVTVVDCTVTISQNQNHDNATTTTTTTTTTRKKNKKSRNTSLILTYTLIAFAGRSIWAQSVLSAFVYILRNNDPEAVGYLTAIMGIFQLVVSFPSGYFADRFRRDSVLKIASLVGIVAVATTIYSTLKASYPLLGVSLATWGSYWGISNPTVNALFADSIQDGERTHYFTLRSMMQFTGQMTGPLLTLFMFHILGDSWKLHDCSFVICTGQILFLPALVLLWFLNDDYCISTTCSATPTTHHRHDHDNHNKHQHEEHKHEHEHEHDEEIQKLLTRNNNNTHSKSLHTTVSSLESTTMDDDYDEEQSILTNNSSSDDNPTTTTTTTPTYNRKIPLLVASSDLISGLGAGMSVRYFPIFFLENLHLTPTKVQIIFAITTLSMTINTKLAQILSNKLGRIQTTILLKWIGISFMVCMALSYQHSLPLFMVCVLFVLRTSIINSTSALTRSVVMDEVPKQQRAKWSALQSVTMFNWAGSAAIGGILVSHFGIVTNFYITSFVQLLGTIPLLLLLRQLD